MENWNFPFTAWLFVVFHFSLKRGFCVDVVGTSCGQKVSCSLIFDPNRENRVFFILFLVFHRENDVEKVPKSGISGICMPLFHRCFFEISHNSNSLWGQAKWVILNFPVHIKNKDFHRVFHRCVKDCEKLVFYPKTSFFMSSISCARSLFPSFSNARRRMVS